jgi:hypothetical protein
MTEVIVSNQVECLKCGDKPFSVDIHDFKPCACGSISVDGGTDYLRRVGDMNPEATKDLSISLPIETVDAAIKAVKWALDTKRNERGIAYAVIRALRDTGISLEVKGKE